MTTEISVMYGSEKVKSRFGDSYTIAGVWINKITNGSVLTSRDKKGIRELADQLRNCIESLKATQDISEINTQLVLVQIVERFPTLLKSTWVHEVQKVRQKQPNKYPGIDDLVTFIENAAIELNDPVYGGISDVKKKSTESNWRPGTDGKQNYKSTNFNVGVNAESKDECSGTSVSHINKQWSCFMCSA